MNSLSTLERSHESDAARAPNFATVPPAHTFDSTPTTPIARNVVRRTTERSRLKQLMSRAMPETIKARLRPHIDHFKARSLAAKSKRIDICAAQFAHVLGLANHSSLAGKKCMEIGAGWVLSHAIVCHLLGAERVLAVDIQPLARPAYLKIALHRSVRSLMADILSPFEDHSRIRRRIDHLLSIKRFDFRVLADLGIEYVSPVDLAARSLGRPYDFAYSQSVLEHVPTDDIAVLLRNLAADMSPGGSMIHCIHLEDHNDFDNRPFDFLSLSAEAYPRWRQTNTGNRVRASAWRKHFAGLEGTTTETLFAFSRTDVELPPYIDPSIDYTDHNDLRVSHLGTLTTKPADTDAKRIL